MFIKFPEFIAPGATIGITAPSFGATTEPYITRFNYAVSAFKKAGYKLKIGETCHKSDGLGISTSPEAAAHELMDFYLDDSLDAIISCGGGEMMCETISCIDFEHLSKAKAKWFMGYSDNTNFIFPMAVMCHTAGIYGPTITGFGKPWERPENDALGLLEGKINCVRGYEYFQSPEADEKISAQNPLAPYEFDEKQVLKTFVPKGGKLVLTDSTVSFSGILLGGCLDVLANLVGTRFDSVNDFNRNSDKIVWVLEECDGNPMEIRRQIWHLQEAGWFDKACGFVIGRPLAAFRQSVMGVDCYNAVTDIIAKLNVPVIMDADVGHISPAMPLVIGAETKVVACNNVLSMTFGSALA